MPRNYYQKSHAAGMHNNSPERFCTICTQERDAGAMLESHARGDHAKLKRKKCSACKAEREAQWRRSA